jgi:hypothetical protein
MFKYPKYIEGGVKYRSKICKLWHLKNNAYTLCEIHVYILFSHDCVVIKT